MTSSPRVSGPPEESGAVPGPDEPRPISPFGPVMSPARKPLDYAELTRPGRRWWRLPLGLLLFVSLLLVWAVLLGVVVAGYGLAQHGDPEWIFRELLGATVTPAMWLFNNLLLAGLIPITVLSTWLTQRIRPGYVHSVAGRFRWRWFGQITLLLLPLWIAVVAVGALLGPPVVWDPDPRLVAFLIICWLTTPLQAAGEEYAFRGWILQNVGGLFTHRVVAWIVPTTISTVAFAVLHGSLDPWILIQLGGFAVSAAIMTWRTGGLEAAVSLHALNNLIVMHYALGTGGIDSSIVTPDSSGTWGDALFSLVSHALAVALVWWWTKRRRVVHTTTADPRAGRERNVTAVALPQRHPFG